LNFYCVVVSFIKFLIRILSLTLIRLIFRREIRVIWFIFSLRDFQIKHVIFNFEGHLLSVHEKYIVDMHWIWRMVVQYFFDVLLVFVLFCAVEYCLSLVFYCHGIVQGFCRDFLVCCLVDWHFVKYFLFCFFFLMGSLFVVFFFKAWIIVFGKCSFWKLYLVVFLLSMIRLNRLFCCLCLRWSSLTFFSWKIVFCLFWIKNHVLKNSANFKEIKYFYLFWFIF